MAKSILKWQPKISRLEGLSKTYDYFMSLPEKEKFKEFKDFK